MLRIHQILAVSICLLLSGPSLAEQSPTQVTGATSVDAAGAKALFDREAAFVDPRKSADWDAGRIPGAIHLDLKSVFNEQNLSDQVGKDEEVVFYCNGHDCLRSSKASAMAVTWGFSKVYYLRDGFPAWKSAGYPVE